MTTFTCTPCSKKGVYMLIFSLRVNWHLPVGRRIPGFPGPSTQEAARFGQGGAGLGQVRPKRVARTGTGSHKRRQVSTAMSATHPQSEYREYSDQFRNMMCM